MKWQERRKLLFDLCGVQSDAEILAGNAKFKPLQEAAGRWSVDEYKQSIRSQRKAVNGSMELLPIRIDEMSKSVAQLREIDFDALGTTGLGRRIAQAQQGSGTIRHYPQYRAFGRKKTSWNG